MAHSRESFIKELRSRVLISPRKTRPLLSSTPIYSALILQDNFHRNLICGFNQDGDFFYIFVSALGNIRLKSMILIEFYSTLYNTVARKFLRFNSNSIECSGPYLDTAAPSTSQLCY